jgi:hypothetical protein
VPESEVRERPPSTLRNVEAGPREVPEPEVWERPPSTLKNVDDEPPGGAGAGDPGAQRLQSPPLGQGGEWLQKARDKCSKSS